MILYILGEACLIGIGRILTNPPSHTTRQAAPHRAVPNLPARQTDFFFDSGKATGYDQNQADPSGTFSAIKQSDLNIISIGQERYEIPDAVIFGG
jgi:hypothetical protein